MVIPHVTLCKTILKLGIGNTIISGSGSSVGIMTDYGLDGSGSNPAVSSGVERTCLVK